MSPTTVESNSKSTPSRVARRVSAYEIIKDAILSRRLEPSAPLVESALAEMCDVSRTPVREALQRLLQDGLVERSDRGLVVRACSIEEILDIYETRIALEGSAARLAAERRTNIDLLQIGHWVSAMEEIAGDDHAATADNNRSFHVAVWNASHNLSLLDLLTRLGHHLERYPSTTLAHLGRWEQAIVEHRTLLDAIDARDAAAAEETAVKHFTTARDIRLLQWHDSLS